MRIAILTELFPPSVGGQEARYAEISKVLSARGHSVKVFCVQHRYGIKQVESADGTMIYRHPQSYRYQKPLLKILRRSPVAVLQYALWCRRIDPAEFDCFLFNQWPIAHILLAPPSIRAKAILDWCEYRSGILFGLLQKYLPRLAANNLANSTGLKQALEARSGRHFEVLPSGIFPALYRTAPAGERSGIVYIGRIEEHKNLPLMLSAYEHLRSKGYRGRLRIAGNGNGLPELQRSAESSPFSDSIDLMGFVGEEQKIELLASSEVMLLTSRREGFPRVIAEAMASGLPVVTVDHRENGAVDVVRQYGIGAVREPHPAEIAEGVLAVMAEWQKYSEACITASRAIDWEVLIGRLLEIAGADEATCA